MSFLPNCFLETNFESGFDLFCYIHLAQKPSRRDFVNPYYTPQLGWNVFEAGGYLA